MANTGSSNIEITASSQQAKRTFSDFFKGIEQQGKRVTDRMKRFNPFKSLEDEVGRLGDTIGKPLENLPDKLKPFQEALNTTRKELRDTARKGSASLDQLSNAAIKSQVSLDKLTSVTKTGKIATKAIANISHAAKEAQLAVLGLNKDGTIKLSTEQSTARLVQFQKEIADTKKNLEQLRDAGDFGSYEAGMLTVEKKLADVNKAMMVVNRGGRGYTKMMRDLGIHTSDMANQSAIAMEGYKDRFLNALDLMNGRATQSSKMIKILPEVSNIQAIDKFFLRIGSGLEQMGKRGMAAQMAVQMLGKNASMKDLSDRVMLINTGIMRMQQLALGSGVAFAGFTAIMVNAAKDSTVLGNSLDKFQKTWTKAASPFVQTWGMIASKVVDAVTAIGDLVNQLNALNPSISAGVGMFGYLFTAMTMILSPMAVGIGMIKGQQVAFSALWAIIGQGVLGFLRVAGMATVVAGAITLIGGALYDSWKNSDIFRNAIVNAFTSVSGAVKPVVDAIGRGISAFVKWEGFSPIILGLAAAFGTLKAIGIATAAINLFTNAERLAAIQTAIMTKLTKAWAVASRLLNLSLLANPYVAIAAAIIGLVVALALVYDRNEKFRNAVNNGFAVIKNTVLTTVAAIKSVSADMWTGMTNGFAILKNTVISSVATIKSVSANMWAGFSNVTGIGPAIQKGFSSAVQSTGAFAMNMGRNIADFFGRGLGDRAGAVVRGFIDQLKAGFSDLGGIVSLIAPTITAIGLSLLGVSGPIGFVITAIVSLIGYFYRLSKTNADVRNALAGAWQGILSVISAVLIALQPILDVFRQSFAQMATQLGPEFQKTGAIIAQSIAQLGPTFQQLGTAFSQLGAEFSTLFAQLIPMLMPLFSQAIQTIASIIPVVLQIAMSILPLLMNTVRMVFPLVLQIIQSVLPIVIQLITSIIPIILNLAQLVLPMILSAVRLVFPVILQIIQSVLPIVIQLISSIVPIILNIVQMILPMLLSMVRMVFPVILSIIQAVLPIVVALIQTLVPIITLIARTLIPLILSVVRMVFPMVLSIIQMVLPLVVNLLKMAASIMTAILIPAIRLILNIVQLVFPAIMKIIQSALNIIINVIRFFTSVLKGDWSGAWTAVKNILSSVWSIIKTVISTALNLIVAVLKGAWAIITSVTHAVFGGIWNFIKSVFQNIYNSVAGFVSRIWQNISNGWNTAKTRTIEIFTSIKDRIVKTFTDIVNGAKALPGRIGEGIRSMAGKALASALDLANKLSGALAKGVNGITGGINWVLGKIGVKTRIPTWNPPKWAVPKYAQGTDGHPGGDMIVGDGRKKEWVQYPDGTGFLSPNKATLVPNAPKGTQVASGEDTKKLMSLKLIPKYASGIGSFFSNLLDKTLDVFSYLTDPKALMKKIWDKLSFKFDSGIFGDAAAGGISMLKNNLTSWVKGKMSDFGSFAGGNAPGNVKNWISSAVGITGVPPSWIAPLITMAMKESGGRTGPSTINKWDSNWKKGIPSMGLMQTIMPTFRAYAKKGLNDIMNPIHNAVAAINYIKKRYGSVFNTPGIKSMMHGGPYKGYAKGGFFMNGPETAVFGDGGPEMALPLIGKNMLPFAVAMAENFRNMFGGGFMQGGGEIHNHYWNVNADEINEVQKLVTMVGGLRKQTRKD